MSRTAMELAILVAAAVSMPAAQQRSYGPTAQDLAQAKALTKKQRVREQIRARRNHVKGDK